MTPAIFFDNFDLLANAPNSIPKLRELIRQLATEGKLIEHKQIENFNNISKLDYKNEIMSEGLPKGWSRVPLEAIAAKSKYPIGDGDHGQIKPSCYSDTGIPYIRVKDIGWGSFEPNGLVYIPEKVHNENLKSELFPGDILLAKTGATIGKCCIIPENILRANTTSSVGKVSVDRHLVMPEWIINCMLTPDFLNQIWAVSMKTAQPGFNIKDLKRFMINLPPLTEQRNILIKVDQLMSLCDELEARQQKKRESRMHLNSAALDKLLTARAPEEFAERWRRIIDNFDLLYDAPENVEKLRTVILQLVVQGKLLSQDMNDEPASILLEKIRLEKESLIKDKKIKKPELLPPINIENILYKLPKGWEWIRLGQIAKSLRYGTSKHCSYGSDGSPVLRIPNLIAGKIDTADLKFTKLSKQELDDLALLKGDILIIRSNGSKSLVGRSAVVNRDMDGYAFAGYLVRLRVFLNQVYPDYLHLSLETSFVREQIEIPIRTTSGVKNINSTEMSRLVIPLPPYKTQKRIVAKVDQLMSLCDKLEAGLAHSQADGERLMEAVVRRMLGA